MTDRAEITTAIADHPFATLVRNGADGPVAAYAPLIFNPENSDQLMGHVARANPFWTDLDGGQVLAIFNGPDAYISPGYYPSKQVHGKVVPTWNYQRIEVRGTVQVESNPDRLRPFVEGATQHMEHGRSAPWAVDDAPPDFTRKLYRAIVGLRIDISSVQGTLKISQNRTEEDQAGVRRGLRADEAEGMSALMSVAREE